MKYRQMIVNKASVTLVLANGTLHYADVFTPGAITLQVSSVPSTNIARLARTLGSNTIAVKLYYY
jgi:hypothetical protein